jgi:hypothetical protein
MTGDLLQQSSSLGTCWLGVGTTGGIPPRDCYNPLLLKLLDFPLLLANKVVKPRRAASCFCDADKIHMVSTFSCSLVLPRPLKPPSSSITAAGQSTLNMLVTICSATEVGLHQLPEPSTGFGLHAVLAICQGLCPEGQQQPDGVVLYMLVSQGRRKGGCTHGLNCNPDLQPLQHMPG